MDTIKNLLSAIFGKIINCVWLALVVLTIVVSFYKEEYWQIWSVGSVISVIVYGFLLIIINVEKFSNVLEDSTSDDSRKKFYKNALKIFVIIMVLLIVGASGVACLVVFPGMFKDDNIIKINTSNFVQVLSFFSVAIFGIIDFIVIIILKMYMEKEDPQQNRRSYNGEVRELESVFYYIDVPSIISILLISAFWFIKLFIWFKSCDLAYILAIVKDSPQLQTQIKQLEIFTSGATAFSFLSFNIAFIVIQSDLLKKRGS
jgi:hypothetical protein